MAEEEIVDIIATGIAEFLDLKREVEKVEAKNWLIKQIEKWSAIPELVECIYLKDIPYLWYDLLWVLGETTRYLRRLGLRIKKEVPAGGTDTHAINLSGTDKTCICPLRTASSEVGPLHSTLTITVNKPPVEEIDNPFWLDVKICTSEPIPSEGPPVNRGWLYTFAPKIKVDWEFGNSYSVDAWMVFYADYFEMDLDDGKDLIRNCFTPLMKMLVGRILGKAIPPEVVFK